MSILIVSVTDGLLFRMLATIYHLTTKACNVLFSFSQISDIIQLLIFANLMRYRAIHCYDLIFLKYKLTVKLNISLRSHHLGFLLNSAQV